MQVISGGKIAAVFSLREFIWPATEGFLHECVAMSSVVDASARDSRHVFFGSLPPLHGEAALSSPEAKRALPRGPGDVCRLCSLGPGPARPRSPPEEEKRPAPSEASLRQKRGCAPSMARGTLMSRKAQKRSKAFVRSSTSPRGAGRTTWPRWSAPASTRLEASRKLEEVFASAGERASKKDPLHSRTSGGKIRAAQIPTHPSNNNQQPTWTA